MLYLMLITWMFGIPAYYLAKSKGRSGKFHGIFAVILGIPLGPLFLLSFILPAAFLLILYLLPAKAGAPGKAYLHITFPCPECGQTITFPRRKEGDADICPLCNELVHIPTDKFSQRRQPTTQPNTDHGLAILETFSQRPPADILAAILNDNDITAHVISDDWNATATLLGSGSGCRVMVEAENWDAALALREEFAQNTPPPPDDDPTIDNA